MITPEEVELREPETVEEEPPDYVINPSRVSSTDRSLASMLLGRRCPTCQARISTNKKPTTEKAHFKEIAGCCAKKEGFIRADMPMQEILFRTILAAANKPVNLERLHYQITEGWYTPVNPRNISMNNLKRVLDSDVYYGFEEVPRAAAQEPGE